MSRSVCVCVGWQASCSPVLFSSVLPVLHNTELLKNAVKIMLFCLPMFSLSLSLSPSICIVFILSAPPRFISFSPLITKYLSLSFCIIFHGWLVHSMSLYWFQLLDHSTCLRLLDKRFVHVFVMSYLDPISTVCCVRVMLCHFMSNCLHQAELYHYNHHHLIHQ